MPSSIQKRISVLIFFCIFPFTAVSNANTISVATGEWIPYSSKSMKHYGEFTKLVTIVFKEMGLEPAYKFYPWRRCFDAVIKGRVWAAFPYSYTEDRAKQVWFSDMISCSRSLLFYYEKGDFIKYNVKSIEDLKLYKLGGIRGYYYENLFEKSGLVVDYVNKELHAVEKLKLGRIDLMPMNEHVGRHLIRTYFGEHRHKFKTLSIPISVNPLMLIVSREYPETIKILEAFNRTLSECVKKGLLTIEPCESEIRLMK